jgi:hypothetical protein
VTNNRHQRTETLKNAARQKSVDKTTAAEAGIRRLIKRGQPVTFQSVQREAGVSHTFLYNHQQLRARIEHQRRQHRPQSPMATDADNENNIIAALTAEIARLKSQHRTESKAMQAALEQAHGENLELRRQLHRRGPGDAQNSD